MIKNEREYRITRAQAEKFRTAIAETGKGPPGKGVHPKLHAASIDGMRAKLEDLEREMKTYESLQKGTKRLRGTLDDLGELLVQARIARGWTQRELADRLGLHMQKIQQYEATNYEGASRLRMLDVARALGMVVDLKVELVDLPNLADLAHGDRKRA